jgi:hypothetical protein
VPTKELDYVMHRSGKHDRLVPSPASSGDHPCLARSSRADDGGYFSLASLEDAGSARSAIGFRFR